MVQENIKTPDNSGYSREELQRMRAEVCGFIDRSAGITQDLESHKFQIDVNLIRQHGFSDHFSIAYGQDIPALVDDVLFYRFVKAARTYMEAPDDPMRRAIARSEFVPYMEYLLNTPQNDNEEVMMNAVGYQPLTGELKEFIADRDADFKFHHHSFPPTFSPEYKTYFLKKRDQYLVSMEPNPDSKTPLIDAYMYAVGEGLSGVPQDVVRDGLPAVSLDFTPKENMEDSDYSKQIMDQTATVLSKLDQTTSRVFNLLLGLNDGIARTYAEVAEMLDMTIAEVKKREAEGFKKLRSNK